MKICPIASERLRVLLAEIEAIRSEKAGLAARVSAAAGAGRRLQTEIADFDRTLHQLSDLCIPAKTDRIAQIIAGEKVIQPSVAEIEERAVQSRQVSALRGQAAEDLAALNDHVGSLQLLIDQAADQIASRERSLYAGLAEAILEVYKRNAIAFVAENLPYLYSIMSAVQKQTGEEPAWAGRVLRPGFLTVSWQAEEQTQETPAHPKLHELVRVWPRADATLLSGELIASDELIEAMIDTLRSNSPAPDQAPAA